MNEYYQNYSYIFPFTDLINYDLVDLKYINNKGVILINEAGDPVKAGKKVRDTTTYPELPDLES